MLRIKKQVVATTLAAGLVFSSVPALGTINTYSNGSVVYAAENIYDDVAARISDVYKMLEPDELTAIRAARAKINENVIKGIINQNSHIANLSDDEKNNLAKFFVALANIQYSASEDELEEALSSLDKDAIKNLFGDNVTSADVYDFLVDFEENLKSSFTNVNFSDFISGGLRNNLQNHIKEVLIDTLRDFEDIYNGFTHIFKPGEIEEGIMSIKTGIDASIDTNESAQIALGLAYLRTQADPLSISVKEGQSTTFNLKIGGRNVFNLDSAIQVQVINSQGDVSNKVTFTKKNVDGNITGEVNASSAKANEKYLLRVSFKHNGNLYLIAKVGVDITSATGGGVTPPPGGGTPGGGTPGAPVTTTPSSDAVPVTEQTGTNAKGQTTNTITINAEAAVKIALDHKEPVNLVITATKAADVTTAPIPVDLINKLNTDDPNNTITLNTPAGAITISVTELSNALLAAAAQGIDVTKAQVNIVVEKGSAADRNLVQNQVGSASEILSDIIQTKIVIVSGDKNTEVKEYKGYVDSTIVLNGTYNASQLVGIDYKGSLGTATKTSLTVAAETSGYAPVPTIITTKDGKTTVVLKKKTSAPFAVVKSNISFSDVTNQWFAKDVTLLANKHLVKGVKENTFAPNQTLTRAEFAAMIVRALGLPEDVNKGVSFSDVKATDWHAGYVGAAAKAGIINGVGDGRFNPNGFVTRQEIAKMVVAAIQYAGGNLSAADKAALGKFSDASKVSDWAVDAVAIAASKGILLGADGKLNPLGNSTRAEAATFIKRFMTDVKFISE